MNTEHVPREVIEGKLLAALDDEGKVAIVLGQRDLLVLMRALEIADHNSPWQGEKKVFREMREDLRELYRAAFMKGE